MSAVDEARRRMREWTPAPQEAYLFDDAIDDLIAAVRADYEPSEEDGRAALWERWTAGERLAYGCGRRDERAALEQKP